MDKDDREVIQLRRRIAALIEEARANETAWQRAQRREMQLLEAGTLDTLLTRMTAGLRASYRVSVVTLLLADPAREIRCLLLAQGRQPRDYRDVAFVDAQAPVSVRGTSLRRPWLGRFDARAHAHFFPHAGELSSVALLPLVRDGSVAGSLNLGSGEARRFTGQLATDFLSHLAVIAAFSLENAVNHARLARSGVTDVLTGWHNRRYLQTRLTEELARCQRDGTTLTCLMIDVDHFKRVNDLYGHVVGDEVLRRVAQRIQAEVRDSDVSARYGGEEFVVLLPATGIEVGRSLAERIRCAVAAEPFAVAGAPGALPVTISIGVAEQRGTVTGADTVALGERLIALADDALYEAKAAGRNAVKHVANS